MPETETKAPVSARDLAIASARMAADTRCTNVIVLDVSDISPVTDYLVLATGTSARQMRSVCDDVEEMAEPLGHRPLTRAGYESENWMLIDFVHVVVHVFAADARAYYDLDNLWGDGKTIDWQAGK